MVDIREQEYRVTTVMTADDIGVAVRRIAQEIISQNADLDAVVLLGILSRGRPLAERIAHIIEEETGATLPVGSLATTLYRDDLRTGAPANKPGQNVTHFDFDVDGKTVVLVDDVLFAGRTARAALDEVVDYGRPQCVRLACLVDRGFRELPIQPDYLGQVLKTKPGDHISVKLTEIDGEDAVLHQEPIETGGGE